MKKALLIVAGICVALFVLMLVIGLTVDVDENGETTSRSRPTNTPASTPTETPTKAPVGLGVSRDAVEDVFSDFDLEDSPLKDGRERLLGGSPDGAATLELIGERDNLEQAALIMTVNAMGTQEVILYSGALITVILPDWEGDADWFAASVIELADSPEQNAETETRYGDARITLTANKQFGWLTLAIKPAEGEAQAQSSPTSTPVGSRPTVPVATLAAISYATSVAEATQQANPDPVPTPTEDYVNPQVRLGPRNLLVGALGNGGIVSGKYEYQDATGNKVVQGDSLLSENQPRQSGARDDSGRNGRAVHILHTGQARVCDI